MFIRALAQKIPPRRTVIPCRRSYHRRLRVGVGGFIALGLTVFAVTPAFASDSGGTTATINVGPPLIRSITVSPPTVTFKGCSGGSSTSTVLGFPSGQCNTNNSAITVTNGPTAGHIFVGGADAVPSSGSTHWTLCGQSGPPLCSGPNGGSGPLPGKDQYNINRFASGTPANDLTTTPRCDLNFNVSGDPCLAAASQSNASAELMTLFGPTVSTDASSVFTTTVTWMAVP